MRRKAFERERRPLSALAAIELSLATRAYGKLFNSAAAPVATPATAATSAIRRFNDSIDRLTPPSLSPSLLLPPSLFPPSLLPPPPTLPSRLLALALALAANSSVIGSNCLFREQAALLACVALPLPLPLPQGLNFGPQNTHTHTRIHAHMQKLWCGTQLN